MNMATINGKEAFLVPPTTYKQSLSRWRVVGMFVLAVMGVYMLKGRTTPREPVLSPIAPARHHKSKNATFSWDDLKASEDLVFTDCLSGLQCARLILPMDPFNDTTDATIELAVLKRPATVPVTDKSYGGMVLTNPGGPGGSGVTFLSRAGQELQEIVDSNCTAGKHFDVVSFDPRGVGLTKPQIQCFQSEAVEHSFNLRYVEEGVLDSSDAALGRIWGMNKAKGQSCSILTKDGADPKQYVATSYVAHDMLMLTEKHGEWREREAARLLNQGCGRTREIAVPQHLKHRKGEEKIQYWGFSYGSYLGNTFAAMYPNRVGRLLVDGVVDAENYRTGKWSNNLLDTEKGMREFSVLCARVVLTQRAPHPSCWLALPGQNNTAEAIEDRIKKIVESLYHHPLPVIGVNPEVITYSDVRTLIFLSLYSPIKYFPRLSEILWHIEQGNATLFASELLTDHTFSCKNPNNNNESRNRLLTRDAIVAIACSDADDRSQDTISEFKQHMKELKELSPTLGSIWAEIRLNCIHYNVRPVHRFTGEWKGKTSHPLFMIGNTADPVTPLAFAIKMASGFEGAVALTQNSSGHCSTNAASKCTVGYIKDYFQTGKLPPVNTTCETDELPFEKGFADAQEMGVENKHARIRHQKIADGLMEAGGYFGGLGGAASKFML